MSHLPFRHLPALVLLLTSCAPRGSVPAHADVTVDEAPSIPRDSVYDVEDVTSRPELLNRKQAARQVHDAYPDDLKLRGIGGTVHVSLIIDPEGEVLEARVHESSGVPELDQAALKAVRRIRFTPGRIGSTPVYVRIVQTVRFWVQ